MAEINDWSTTAGSNGTGALASTPDGWPENMNSSTINNTAREGMAVVARAWTDAVEGDLNSTGSVGAYLLAANRTLAAYYDGMKVAFHANHANTGAATIKVDGLATVDIKKNVDDVLVANDIITDQYVELVYSLSATNFQMLTPVGNTNILSLVDDTTPQLGGALDPNAQFIGMDKGTDVASGTPTIDTDGDYFDVTGTTTVTAWTVAANRHFFTQFDGAVQLTHHATNLDLPGEANITTAAGDVAEWFSTGTNTCQCVNFTKADGTAVVVAVAGGVTFIEEITTSAVSSWDFTNFDNSSYDDYMLVLRDVAPANDLAKLAIRYSTDASTFITTAYTSSVNATTTSINLTDSALGNSTNESSSGVVFIHGAGVAAFTKCQWNLASYNSTPTLVDTVGAGQHALAQDTTGVQVLFTAGNIASGTAALYGIRKA